jgi:Ca-activated chloride channel homolog
MVPRAGLVFCPRRAGDSSVNLGILLRGPRHHNRGVLAALAVLCGAVAYARIPQSASPAALDQGTISVETDLVVLPVSVTGARGDFISGLKQEQFRVYEDGRPQQITLFQEEDTPITVGLAVDHSRSMGPKLLGVAAAISAFAQSSNPDDEMFVVNFSDNVSMQWPGGPPFTSNPQTLAHAVSGVSAGGMTALYDAVAEGLNHLQLGRADKKALVIVSDGGDNASKRKYADVLELARRSQAVIYAIGLVGALGEEENPGVLRRLCKDTGGLAFFPAGGKSVSEISASIARDLRKQYTLGFASQKRSIDSYRKVRVEVTAPGQGKLQLRTRSGYFTASHQRASVRAIENRSSP